MNLKICITMLRASPGFVCVSLLVLACQADPKTGAARPPSSAATPAKSGSTVASAGSSASRAAPAAAQGGAGGSRQSNEVATEVARQAVPARLVAIGDVHGDLAATRAALKLGGAIDDSDHWVGGNLTVVQTGDQLDRGDDERAILDLFERLLKEAAGAGGRFIALNGNHETMNVQGDFRYVTPAGLRDFEGAAPSSPYARAVPPPYTSRAAAFLPGGAYARVLARRDVIAIVGDSVFVHGGVLPEHVSYGIARINREVREWMRSGDPRAPASVASERAPVWVRDYSLEPMPAANCDMLGKVLAGLGVKRMVVGHTVQREGISSGCGERVYRIDVGLARYYGNSPVQVLEIEGNVVRVLSAPSAR